MFAATRVPLATPPRPLFTRAGARSLVLRLLACTLVPMLLAACGGGGSPTPPTPPTPVAAPTITTQPADQTITENDDASFNVVASGTGLSHQWQESQNGGTTWSDLPGATAATLLKTAVPLAHDARQYRARVSNTGGSVTSNAALLSVNALPAAPAVVLGSARNNGTLPNNVSTLPSLSANGRWLAFQSTGTDLVAGTVNWGHAYVRDLVAGTTTLINARPDGGESVLGANSIELSANGRYAVFGSVANDLIANDTNGAGYDFFVRDLQTSTTTRVNVTAGGAQVSPGGGIGNAAQISDDGRYVLIVAGQNLEGAGELLGGQRVFIRDQVANTIIGLPALDNIAAIRLSGNGRHIAAISAAAGTNTLSVYDIDTHTYTPLLVINTTGFVEFLGGRPAISEDGQRIAFQIRSPSRFGNSSTQVAVYDRAHPATSPRLASRTDAGAAGNGTSSQPLISGDGRYVAFVTDAANLRGGVVGRAAIVHDLDTDTTRIASRTGAGTPVALDSAISTAISASGSHVAFGAATPDMGFVEVNQQIFVASRP